jgi:hypothetical protein
VNIEMKPTLVLLSFLFAALCLAQDQPAAPASNSEDISGMYTFLQEGEFVQIDVDGTRVTGFVSRYGDLESDKGAFLDHLFKEGELKGNAIHFVTKAVHGVWFEFQGTVEHGNEKDPSKEGYRVLKGKLTQFTEGDKAKPNAKSRELTMKSFPMGELVDRSK